MSDQFMKYQLKHGQQKCCVRLVLRGSKQLVVAGVVRPQFFCWAHAALKSARKFGAYQWLKLKKPMAVCSRLPTSPHPIYTEPVIALVFSEMTTELSGEYL